MSDAPDTPFDPTESVRTLTSDPFKETFMTLREHQDTDKHYIGDALPVPSLSQVSQGGIWSFEGKLPFPARVDHAHELKMAYTFLNSGYRQFVPGESFFNNISYIGWGGDWRATTQTIAFPSPGLYFLHANIAISREAGGTYVNEGNVNFYYNNGTNPKTVYRSSNFDLPSVQYITATDIFATNSAPSINDNVQISIAQNDASGWQAALQHLIIFRLCSPWHADH